MQQTLQLDPSAMSQGSARLPVKAASASTAKLELRFADAYGTAVMRTKANSGLRPESVRKNGSALQRNDRPEVSLKSIREEEGSRANSPASSGAANSAKLPAVAPSNPSAPKQAPTAGMELHVVAQNSGISISTVITAEQSPSVANGLSNSVAGESPCFATAGCSSPLCRPATTAEVDSKIQQPSDSAVMIIPAERLAGNEIAPDLKLAEIGQSAGTTNPGNSMQSVGQSSGPANVPAPNALPEPIRISEDVAKILRDITYANSATAGIEIQPQTSTPSADPRLAAVVLGDAKTVEPPQDPIAHRNANSSDGQAAKATASTASTLQPEGDGIPGNGVAAGNSQLAESLASQWSGPSAEHGSTRDNSSQQKDSTPQGNCSSGSDALGGGTSAFATPQLSLITPMPARNSDTHDSGKASQTLTPENEAVTDNSAWNPGKVLGGPPGTDSASHLELRIAMQTERLGNVQLHAHIAGEELGASIIVERKDAHTMLAVELPALQQALSEKNLRIEQLSLLHAAPNSTAGDTRQSSQDQVPAAVRQPLRNWNAETFSASAMVLPQALGIFDSRGRLSVRA